MNDTVFSPGAYTEGGPFQREKQTVFSRRWLPFAASGQMRAPGDVIGHTIGGWPLFAVRGEDGTARAFHNVCRHQSMPLVDQGPAHCDVLRCRYHGWSYGFDGHLVEAPPRYAPAEPAAEITLAAAELTETAGICFVRVTRSAEPPPSFGVPSGHLTAALTTDIDANWKAVLETLIDGAAWRLIFPLALIGESRGECTIVRQVVPRTFSRTRMIDLVFSGSGGAEDSMLATCREHAAADKEVAETRQARRAAGEPPPAGGPVTEFLAQVAAATLDGSV